jgi:hypothetical protein
MLVKIIIHSLQKVDIGVEMETDSPFHMLIEGLKIRDA